MHSVHQARECHYNKMGIQNEVKICDSCLKRVGMYWGTNEDEYKPIDIIGFEENKAIFWNSKMVHAPAHIAKWGLWRYAIIGYFN